MLLRVCTILAVVILMHPVATAQDRDSIAEGVLFDGDFLAYSQSPPLVRADRPGGLSFEILIVGVIEEVAIERYSWNSDTYVTSRWPRMALITVDGSLVSMFAPTYSQAELWDTLASEHRGYDRPAVIFGTLTWPDQWANLSVRIAPADLPTATIVQLNESIQYSSHMVNIAVPEPIYISNGHREGVTRLFFEHFMDHYESIAIVIPGDAFYTAAYNSVRNPILGLGTRDDLPSGHPMEVYDYSAQYGSRGHATVHRGLGHCPKLVCQLLGF